LLAAHRIQRTFGLTDGPEKVIDSICFSVLSPELIRKHSVAEITKSESFGVVEKAKVEWTWRGKRSKEKFKKGDQVKELVVYSPLKRFEEERVKGWLLSPLKGPNKRVKPFTVGQELGTAEIVLGGLMDNRLGVCPTGVIPRGIAITEPETELDVEEAEEIEAYEVIEKELESQKDVESKVEIECGTCSNKPNACPGHFGHIELAEPMVHTFYVREIHRLLSETCRNCGKFLGKSKFCSSCNTKQRRIQRVRTVLKWVIKKKTKERILVRFFARKKRPKKVTEQETEIIIFNEIFKEDKKETPFRLMPSEIRERLKRIKDDDLEKLGYNPGAMRPEWLVLEVLPVPPITMRFCTLEGRKDEIVSYRQQEVPDVWYDDLTYMLARIVFINNRIKGLKQAWERNEIVREEYEGELKDLADQLQRCINFYLSTIKNGLEGKRGRFRYNLNGKRVNFCARSVITPDPNIDICEVGVPEEIARKLTIAEVVSHKNLSHLRQFVENGPSKYPGANSVVFPEGKRIELSDLKEPEISALAKILDAGYKVERHLVDGDLVLFNRQPSLHRMSIMAHRVKVLPGKSFRLHPAVCTPYNADFDGDCMNLHVPQIEGVKEELEKMFAENHLVSPRYGYPIIGAIRDFVHAAYLLTKDDTFLSKQEFCNLAISGGYYGDLPEPKQNGPYSGKQLFSLFLPKGFNYHGKSEWNKKGNFDDVVIEDGQLISGVIDRATIGAERSDSILHALARQYGNEQAFNFLDSILRVLTKFVTNYGFSYSMDEVMLKEDVLKQIEQVVNAGCSRVEQNTKANIDVRTKEAKVQEELKENFGKICEIVVSSLPESNSGIIMSRTGASKAKEENITQMAACLGQQYVNNRRIGVSERWYSKALSHFADYSKPEAMGFVKSSFSKGLSPTEYFFHAMGGREGEVERSVGPQRSGYMYRRLSYALGSLRLERDLTVRDDYGNIIQFAYGVEGIEPSEKGCERPRTELGTMVGMIAAQSISEPATQMTLKAFHYAGALRPIKTGLARLIQIVNVPKDVEASMRIHLDEENRHSRENVLNLSNELKTIDGISETSVEYDKESSEWFIVTTGSNLKGVFTFEWVDKKRTISNNPREVAEVLGIEAARDLIVQEIKETLGELEVDTSHILLLADAMCFDGEPESIGRHGLAGKKEISKDKEKGKQVWKGILSRAAFEVPFKVLTEAALEGESDELKGVFENVVVGRPTL